ncbi:hypothetical protein GW879_01680, partial [Candidatus Kaiserbacteria bacterium]|nr:hypothetical protein [Candidatus Kaiserbacteria bacterium]
MRILSIETSCDETAVSIIEAMGDFPTATYQILGNALFSQIEIHKEFGGVFPMMAKREHAKALVPMLEQALTEAELLENTPTEINDSQIEKITFVLERENGLADTLLEFLKAH